MDSKESFQKENVTFDDLEQGFRCAREDEEEEDKEEVGEARERRVRGASAATVRSWRQSSAHGGAPPSPESIFDPVACGAYPTVEEWKRTTHSIPDAPERCSIKSFSSVSDTTTTVSPSPTPAPRLSPPPQDPGSAIPHPVPAYIK